MKLCLRLTDLHRLLYHALMEASVKLQFCCDSFIVIAASFSLLYRGDELAKGLGLEH
jgi:hypothetical protein